MHILCTLGGYLQIYLIPLWICYSCLLWETFVEYNTYIFLTKRVIIQYFQILHIIMQIMWLFTMRPCNTYYALPAIPYISRLIFKTFSMHSYYVLCAPTASYALSVRPIRFHCARASLNVPVAQIYEYNDNNTYRECQSSHWCKSSLSLLV